MVLSDLDAFIIIVEPLSVRVFLHAHFGFRSNFDRSNPSCLVQSSSTEPISSSRLHGDWGS